MSVGTPAAGSKGYVGSILGFVHTNNQDVGERLVMWKEFNTEDTQ